MKHWWVYVLQTWATNPVRVYVGQTERHWQDRVREQVEGGPKAALICRNFGVKRVIFVTSVPTKMHADALEQRWAEDLAFIFENEGVIVSNGINRWAFKGKLESNLECTTSSDMNKSTPHFNYDRLPPRDLLYQRRVWRYRVMNPVETYEPPRIIRTAPIPKENQLSISYTGLMTLSK
jgi:hypothetical protein